VCAEVSEKKRAKRSVFCGIIYGSWFDQCAPKWAKKSAPKDLYSAGSCTVAP